MQVVSYPKLISHEWPAGRGTTLVAGWGLVNQGNSPLTNLDDPPGTHDQLMKNPC